MRKGPLSAWRKLPGRFTFAALLSGLLLLLFSAPSARADSRPPGCTGSGLGILLFTDARDVHIGDTLNYSVTVFNGTGTGPVVCDSTGIQAFVVTPDGVSHPITLVRTTLASGQSDFYPMVVSYVVRAQDIQPDGTVRATASDTGIIHQNDTDSMGGGNQGVNTEVSLPCIALLVQCVGGVGENGLITFSGTVTNCGNNTLVGVTVTNFVNGGQFQVTFITNLLKGQIASFSGSWIPLNPCSPSTATFVAQGVDQFTTFPKTVTSSVDTTCQNALTPGIKVTKACPIQPISPGQLLTFSGSVSNTGNVTLTNIVVVNNQPAVNTTVFAVASLAPGAVTNFTGNYLAPTNCSVSDTLTASANSRCGVPVSDTASATCPITTTPGITVTEVCPTTPGVSGGSSSYSGVVRNSGNITLNNVVVVSDRPAANTVVFTAAALAPGASANYSGTFTVPLNVCTVTTAVRATGNDSCTGVGVTNTASATCPIITAPAISVTLACPVVQSITGGSITYTGTVLNSGNVTLNNIVVTDSQSSPTNVFTIASLAPGASANFTASFTSPANACSVSSTVNASGSDNCTAVVVSSSASATCALATNPRIVVTQNCSGSPTTPGGVLNYSGTVSNAGNITLTNIVVTNDRTGTTPIFAALALLPGRSTNFTGSYTVPAGVDCSITSTVTASGNDNCSGNAVINTASTTCSITGTPLIAVTLNCPETPVVTGNSITFSGTVSNPGNVTLINVTVVNSQTSPSTVLSLSSLAPGASAPFTATFNSPVNACSVSSTVTARGGNTCTASIVTNTSSATCTLLTTPAIAVRQNCPVTLATAGGVLNYSGSVSNAGNITLTNVVVINSQTGTNRIYTALALLPGAVSNFTGSYTVPVDTLCSISSTATATGREICAGNTLTNTATATCTLATAPAIAVTLSCPTGATAPGAVITYSGTVRNSGNVTLNDVTVVNNQTSPSTVLTVASLAPGASANFTASFTAPLNACSVSSSVVARGTDACTSAVVTNSATATCPITGTPLVAITLNCPGTPVVTGNSISFSGTVSNPGNVTLINVTVVDNQASPSTVLTLPTLAPGASANFTATFASPANACSVSSTVTARGSNTCTTVASTASASATCTLLTTPAIVVRQNCPVIPVTAGGLLAYSGSVSNAGNITLTNIVVINSQTGTNVIYTALALLPGAVSNFTGSYTVPIGTLCSVSSTATATGREICSGNTLTNTATATCTLATAPAIAVTLNCPTSATAPGGVITYSGTVRNSGNVTLNDVTVVNNQTSPSTVLTVASLAPGASANFTASFTAPLNACSVSSSVVARGTDACTSAVVTNSASATCPIVTAPSITITENCPATPVGPGGVLTFSGTIRNSGDVTLTNVVVTSDRTGTTPVLTVATLAAGATANYTGSYTVPVNGGCTITTVVSVTGNDTCSGIAARNTASVTCPIIGTPRIVVTQKCPLIQVSPGDVLTYSGTVSNAGNVTLTNVVVTNDRTGTTPVLTIASLAPRATANFTGTYVTHDDCCVDSSTVTATGRDCNNTLASDTATRTCTLLTRPAIAVTAVCSPDSTPLAPGDVLNYSGIVSNSGNITLINVTIVNNTPTNGSHVFGPITLAAGETASYTASFIVPADFCGTHTVTARGLDSCTQLPVTNNATTTCPIKPSSPGIAVTKNCPLLPTPYGGTFTYTGTVLNTGNATLINVFVVDNAPSNNTPVIGPITLAPGASRNFSASYPAPTNCCQISDTLTARGQDRCSGSNVAATATQVCPLLTTPRIAVVEHCPTATIPVGGLYEFTGSVTNTGDVVLTDVYVVSSQPVANTVVLGPFELAPGESEEFSGSFIVLAGSGGLIVTASGFDTCQARLAIASANCSGPITPLKEPSAITVVTNGNGAVSGVANGLLLNIGQSYTVLAMPAAGSSFVNWSGGVSATTPSLTFVMQSNLVLIANFALSSTNGSNQPRAITVVVNGNGTVSGVTNNQLLNIGQSYTATATPAAGSAFVNWSGGVSATTPSLTFVMQSNLVLNANFDVTSTNAGAFIPVAGTFSGLFFNATDVQTSNSGHFHLTMTLASTYKAKVGNKGKTYSVSGTFDSNGRAVNTIPRAGMTPLTVNWEGSLSDPHYISGTVSDGTAVAQLAGGYIAYNAGYPAPQAGRYTLIIPGIEDATDSPTGNGYATAFVGADGVVHFKGKLADGTVVVQNVALNEEGEMPLCISLYQGKGMLIGWLQFADDGTNDISGTLRWVKPNLPTSKLYKPGFSVNSEVTGSHYVVPIGTDKMLQITDGVVVLNGGNLPNSSNPVTFGPGSKLVNNGPNALKLTFKPASGLFKGTFTEAGATSSFAIKGAVLQRQNNGSGHAPGSDQSGRVVFRAAP